MSSRFAAHAAARSPFDEFSAEIGDLLFQIDGAAGERLEVGRGAEAEASQAAACPRASKRRLSSRVM
ncbi:hypothetical protein [Streptomyces sp. NPDC000618]|uniref:hypothetical protein n=1 Tax=Streptomyces sp. NPDC000618 TaxID=3154265 RepID=UPI0033317618